MKKPAKATPPDSTEFDQADPTLGKVWFGRPLKYRETFCALLLQHMSQGMSFESFAAVVGVSRATLYNWEKSQPDFLDAHKRGESASLSFWEATIRMGARGELKTVRSEKTSTDPKTGNATVVERKFKTAFFNATGTIFAMKNRFPDLYRDRRVVALEDPDDADISDLTPQEILAKAEARLQRMRKTVGNK